MKTIFNNYGNLIDAWLVQEISSGKTYSNKLMHDEPGEQKTSRMFFEGKKLYSYGLHYEMARIMTDDTIIINSKKSTNTTENQKWKMLRRLLKYTVFIVPSFFDHDMNISFYKSEINKELLTASRSRVNWRMRVAIAEAQSLITEFSKYIETFDLPADDQLAYWLEHMDNLLLPYNIIIV